MTQFLMTKHGEDLITINLDFVSYIGPRETGSNEAVIVMQDGTELSSSDSVLKIAAAIGEITWQTLKTS